MRVASLEVELSKEVEERAVARNHLVWRAICKAAEKTMSPWNKTQSAQQM